MAYDPKNYGPCPICGADEGKKCTKKSASTVVHTTAPHKQRPVLPPKASNTIFGWCMDQHHEYCKRQFVDSWNRVVVCSCGCHEA